MTDPAVARIIDLHDLDGWTDMILGKWGIAQLPKSQGDELRREWFARDWHRGEQIRIQERWRAAAAR